MNRYRSLLCYLGGIRYFFFTRAFLKQKYKNTKILIKITADSRDFVLLSVRE